MELAPVAVAHGRGFDRHIHAGGAPGLPGCAGTEDQHPSHLRKTLADGTQTVNVHPPQIGLWQHQSVPADVGRSVLDSYQKTQSPKASRSNHLPGIHDSRDWRIAEASNMCYNI